MNRRGPLSSFCADESCILSRRICILCVLDAGDGVLQPTRDEGRLSPMNLPASQATHGCKVSGNPWFKSPSSAEGACKTWGS